MGGGRTPTSADSGRMSVGAAAVDADALVDDAAADDLLEQRPGGVVDLALRSGNSSAQLVDDGRAASPWAALRSAFCGDAGDLGQPVGADGLDPGGDLVAVVDLRLPLERGDQAGGLGRVDQLALGVDRLADPGLGGLEAPGDDLFGHVRGAVLVEVPGLPRCRRPRPS